MARPLNDEFYAVAKEIDWREAKDTWHLNGVQCQLCYYLVWPWGVKWYVHKDAINVSREDFYITRGTS